MTREKGTAMRTMIRSGLVALLAIGLLSCESRTDKTDGGGVLLSISAFNGLPVTFSMNSDGTLVQIDNLTIRNVAKNPDATTSSLMDVEITSYTVTYKRLDKGTRTPPALSDGLFGTVPVNGNDSIVNLPVMTAAQLRNPPLSDLLLANGGLDSETLSPVIPIELQLTFYGKTLSGDSVSTQTVTWHIDFTR
jgi:hypothetical protein